MVTEKSYQAWKKFKRLSGDKIIRAEALYYPNLC